MPQLQFLAHAQPEEMAFPELVSYQHRATALPTVSCPSTSPFPRRHRITIRLVSVAARPRNQHGATGTDPQVDLFSTGCSVAGWHWRSFSSSMVRRLSRFLGASGHSLLDPHPLQR